MTMSYRSEYEKWLASPALSEEEKAELRAAGGSEKELESRFYGPLEFGTAGLRGIMGMGTNRMNRHVVRHASQAFANVILAEGKKAAENGVALCFDCRNHSEEFARETASVMAANGIPVRIFESLRPTPELSFAIREYGCTAGVNVTASHNPKEYNGYKVYWSDGAQLPPRHAAAIAAEMAKLDPFCDVKHMPFTEAEIKGFVTVMGAETDERFLENVLSQATDREVVRQMADKLRLVFTPFHGAGYRLIPEALQRLGLRHVICVPEQMVVDGNFPTVESPNPENPDGFALAVRLARENGADLIIGSDPDADRVGVMVRNGRGEYVPISGNQTGVLLIDYLLRARKAAGRLPENAAVLKTIVTTEMARVVAERNGAMCFDTFTGFKFMAEKKAALEAAGTHHVIFSYEESYGYMIGDYVRDKDAVTASLLLAEMAASYAAQGMTLYDALPALYAAYGRFGEKTLNLVMPGIDGLEKMKALMASLRKETPKEIGGVAVSKCLDYLDGVETDAGTGACVQTELSGSNVLRFTLSDGTAVLVRPSGTEPKIKIYILARGEPETECKRRLARCAKWAESLRQ